MVELNTFQPACASLASLASNTAFPEMKADCLLQLVAQRSTLA